MERQRYSNAGLRAWWSVHVEAWRRSGMTQAAYCRRQGLEKRTFCNWLKALNEEESAKKLEFKRRVRSREPTSRQKRNRAVQAFWAMHVEAMQWSGMRVLDYAAALDLSRPQLYRWRHLLETGEVEVDWRGLLHPSARPPLSATISTSAYLPDAESALTDAALQVRAGRRQKGRRRFSVEEKRSILHEAAESGRPLTAVAKAHGIAGSMIFRWRAELGVSTEKAPLFAMMNFKDGTSAGSLDHLLPVPKGARLVELDDGRRVYAPVRAKPDTVRREVAARETPSC